jgi:DNA-binding transcriptional LysR family regulator
MELRHLRYFIAVAEEGSFSRAARRLLVAQPSLSQQIRALEAELGRPLFERSREGLVLNEAGHLFLAGARRTLNEADLLLRQLKTRTTSPHGRLVVGYSPLAPFGKLPLVLKTLRQTLPQLELVIRVAPTELLVKLLNQSELDVVFSPIEPVKGFGLFNHDQTLASELVRVEQWVAVVPTTHPLAEKAEQGITLTELVKRPFVWFSATADPPLSIYFEQTLFQSSGLEPKVQVQVNHQFNLFQSVGADWGVSLVPEASQGLKLDNVTCLPLIDSTSPQIKWHLLWNTPELSPLLQTFLSLVRQTVSPSW